MFDFKIRFIFIEETLNGMRGNNSSAFLMSVYGTEGEELNSGRRYFTWNNNSFSWYSTIGYVNQLNYLNRKYCYVAF